MLRLIVLAAAVSLLAAAVPAYLMPHGQPMVQVPLQISAPAIDAPQANDSAAAQPRYSGRQVELASDAGGNFVSEFRLNGRRTTAIVDTGASAVAMNETTARQIGISVAPSDFRYSVQTANGATRAAAAVIGEIEIGRIRIDNVQAIVLPDAALPTTLIGMTFLRGLSHYSVDGDRLTLVQ